MRWMKNVFIGGLVLSLMGCSLGYEIQTLEEYFLNNNYVQDQNNSSKNVPPLSPLISQEAGLRVSSAWVAENYPSSCAWYDLTRVVDGDTVIVEEGNNRIRVRMIGIDTPESKKEGTPIEAYALDASAALKAKLKNETKVCLIEDEIGDKYDTYGRKLSYVFTADGNDLNREMIIDGWAKAYTRFPMERTKEFERLERAARQQKVGQWE